MLIATNAGAGMNFGFPDPCLTPAAPAPIVAPYPNFAMHAQAAGASPNIFIGMMPALNMLAIIPMTIGDELGVAHPLFKQMGQFTMGNMFIIINCAPAINLLCPTSGNMMNNPLGAVLVPSVTTTFFCDRDHAQHIGGALDEEALRSLDQSVRASDQVIELERHGDLTVLRIARFVSATPALVYGALRDAGDGALVIDLRGNPGGDVDAAIELAADFLPEGTVIALRCDSDGDELPIHARTPQRYAAALTIWVDSATGSAAELFAASLQHHHRACILGEPTAGKGSAQAVVPSRAGAPRYATVARYALPDGRDIDGAGVTPDGPIP